VHSTLALARAKSVPLQPRSGITLADLFLACLLGRGRKASAIPDEAQPPLNV
jgi:hypothetical protein